MLASPNEPPSKATCKRPRSENKVSASRPHWRKRGHKNPCLSGSPMTCGPCYSGFTRTSWHRMGWIIPAEPSSTSSLPTRSHVLNASMSAGFARCAVATKRERDALASLRPTPRSGPQNHRRPAPPPAGLGARTVCTSASFAHHQTYWAQATQLHRQLRGQFDAAQRAIRAFATHLHRASSLVENFNGRRHSDFFLRRQLGPRDLD